jgi:uncharacterized membrane protein
MPAGLLAVLSAAMLGSADFVGGMAAKRANAVVVVTWSNIAGLFTALVATAVFLPGVVSGADAAWGAMAGLCGSVGAVLLYYALASGSMSIVAPTTAATAAVIPILGGVLAGNRLPAMAVVGVVLAVVSILLVSISPASGGEHATLDRAYVEGTLKRKRGAGLRILVCALAAGAGFGGLFVLLAQTSTEGTLWPLVFARCATVPLLLGTVVVRRLSLAISRWSWSLALLCGFLDMTSTILYLIAVRQGDLAIIGVLASLYPASTVLLARFVLQERIRPIQLCGIVLAVASFALLAFS